MLPEAIRSYQIDSILKSRRPALARARRAHGPEASRKRRCKSRRSPRHRHCDAASEELWAVLLRAKDRECALAGDTFARAAVATMQWWQDRRAATRSSPGPSILRVRSARKKQ